MGLASVGHLSILTISLLSYVFILFTLYCITLKYSVTYFLGMSGLGGGQRRLCLGCGCKSGKITILCNVWFLDNFSNLLLLLHLLKLNSYSFFATVAGRARGGAAGQGRGDRGAEERVRQGHRQRDGQPEVRTACSGRSRNFLCIPVKYTAYPVSLTEVVRSLVGEYLGFCIYS